MTPAILEQHYNDLHRGATVHAVAVAKATGAWGEVDDFRQDLIAAVCSRVRGYDPAKASPKTFIEVCLASAKRDLLAAMYADKRRVAISGQAIGAELEGAQAPHVAATVPDYVDGMPERLAGICTDILSGYSAVETAKRRGVTPRDVARAVTVEARAYAHAPMRPTVARCDRVTQGVGTTGAATPGG